MIKLNCGGEFDERDLVEHIIRSPRNYIIQGQKSVVIKNHPKRQSLDFWLRQFANSPNRKQADDEVASALVATGLFARVDKLKCPESGTYCKGLVLLQGVPQK